MVVRMIRAHLLALALLTSPFAAGCLMFAGRHWDETRDTVIEPINSILHKHLPRAVQARDIEAVLSLYATETATGLVWNTPVEGQPHGYDERRLLWHGPDGEETIRSRYESLLTLFPTIEDAELRIHRIHWDATRLAEALLDFYAEIPSTAGHNRVAA